MIFIDIHVSEFLDNFPKLSRAVKAFSKSAGDIKDARPFRTSTEVGLIFNEDQPSESYVYVNTKKLDPQLF